MVIIIIIIIIIILIIIHYILLKLCASQLQPRASPPPGKPPGIPRAFEKMFKCPALRASFVGKCHAPRSYYDGQMPGPSSPSDQYTKLLVAIFNKHNCFGSIELHKTGHEMSHSDWKKDKANDLIAFIGLLWSINALHLLQNDSAWLLETLDSERHRKMTTGYYETSFLLFANARGAGTLLTAKCPAPGTDRATNFRVLPRGGCSRLELTRTLFTSKIALNIHANTLCGGTPSWRS